MRGLQVRILPRSRERMRSSMAEQQFLQPSSCDFGLVIANAGIGVSVSTAALSREYMAARGFETRRLQYGAVVQLSPTLSRSHFE